MSECCASGSCEVCNPVAHANWSWTPPAPVKVGPVFGPDRPRAAVAAITELEAARAMLVSLDHCFTPKAIDRHRRAAQVRAMYPEYGDSFRGH